VITTIEGRLSEVGVDWVDVIVGGGVGLRVSVPTALIERVGVVGDIVKLHTSLQVKEDSLDLYGFPAPEGRKTFEALLGVNGVGPRVALSILSRLTPEQLAVAVASQDASVFKGVSGVGARIAERIILELKGKLTTEITTSATTSTESEVIEALTALGYSTTEVSVAVNAIPIEDELSFEEKLRIALEGLAE
tara:strand:- start:142 stop:717 length:576 start_codon:yes stop_codon:yes gene_type:complete